MEKENTRCIQLQNWMLFAIFATGRTGNEFGQFKKRVLAPKLSIACGSMHIEWVSSSSNLARHMGDIFTQDTEDLKALNIALRDSPAMQIINKHTSWEDQRNNQGVTIEELLSQYRLLQATDARDRIYALLALVTPPAKWWLDANFNYKEPTPILADYSKTATELYKYILTLKYPQGAKTKSIDAEIVAGILPATLALSPNDTKVKEIIDQYCPNDTRVKEIINQYFPNGWDPS